MRPKWTVLANLRALDGWIGNSWEFFNREEHAQLCYDMHILHGNVPTKRPFHKNDIKHMHILEREEIG
jgi:hypothetical protein